MKKKIITMLALLVVAVSGAWAKFTPTGFYLEVDGTSATLKYDAEYNTESGDFYWGENGGYMYWSKTENSDSDVGYADFTTLNVDASCKDFAGTKLEALFVGWASLTTINDLGNLNTTNVTNMSHMFEECVALTTLDLSSFNTTNVTNMERMFLYSKFLGTIYVGDGWSTDNVTMSGLMFYGCTSLPNYNEDVTDKTKAHTGDGGYLTYKATEPESIELTKNADGSWTLAQMPAFDVELEVEYKTDLTLTVNISDWTAGSTANTPTVEGNEGNGTVTYEYKVKGDADDNYTTDVPTEAGEYTVRATVAETDDYADGTATADFTIAAPEAPASTDIVVTANQAITNGAYWATFYTTEGNYQAPTGTEVYAITLNNGKLTMNPVADGIVNSGLAVVLKSTTGSLTMTKTETNSTFQGTSSLNGTLTEINGNANGNIYVLNTGSKGAGFYKLADDGTVPANKAYLVYDGAAGARDYFLFDETTSISEELRVKSEEIGTAPVYDLQGRRVNTPTKGVYIVNGRKVVVK